MDLRELTQDGRLFLGIIRAALGSTGQRLPWLIPSKTPAACRWELMLAIQALGPE
jgi:hypothetical protein